MKRAALVVNSAGRSEMLQRLRRRAALLPGPIAFTRKLYLQLFGAKIGAGTSIPKCIVPWPHQLEIGSGCILEPDIYFKFDGYWQPGPSIRIGDRVFIGCGVEFNVDDSGIGSGCVLADHNHGTAGVGSRMRDQPAEIAPIHIGRDVIVGVNSVILKGIEIGDGAVVAAGSVVTRSIPTNEIWGGNPARKIRDRR
jgi:acetyltransferase-like isoleucine patch superfamily enzyme